MGAMSKGPGTDMVHECITFGCIVAAVGKVWLWSFTLCFVKKKRVKDTSRYLLSEVRFVDFTVTGVGGEEECLLLKDMCFNSKNFCMNRRTANKNIMHSRTDVPVCSLPQRVISVMLAFLMCRPAETGIYQCCRWNTERAQDVDCSMPYMHTLLQASRSTEKCESASTLRPGYVCFLKSSSKKQQESGQCHCH